MNYNLNFTIPQGPTGPTGPVGPTSGLIAYGGKYNTSPSSISLGIGTQTQVPLPITTPNLNTTYTPTNSITISQEGIYEINYYINLSVAVGATLTIAVRANGTNIPATIMSRALSVGSSSIFNNSIIVKLAANTAIDMAISALIAVGVTLNNGTGASLTVKKLN